MIPPKGNSILPLAASISGVLLASAWIYQLIQTKTASPSSIDETEEPTQHDALINREIGVSRGVNLERRLLSRNTITIAYASTTGTCAAYANRVYQSLLKGNRYTVQLVKVAEIDWWDELVNNEDDTHSSEEAGSPPVVLFVLPTWTNGTLPPESQVIVESLDEISSDWRVAPEPLRGKDSIRVAAFGYVMILLFCNSLDCLCLFLCKKAIPNDTSLI